MDGKGFGVKSPPTPNEHSVGGSTATLTGIIDEDHRFEVLSKGVRTPDDMRLWERSYAYAEYLGFVLALNDEVKGKSISEGSENPSSQVLHIVKILDTLSKMIDEIPPIEQPQRFGNQAFRTWYAELCKKAPCFLKDSMLESHQRSVPEIIKYLTDAFGNSTRIDYGTGHEISFVMFMYCLFRIGYLQTNDRCSAVCCIFVKYLDLVRKLQQTYRMEPAGSHGVWSLDDYQFVPFIWGSSQLINHPKLATNSFLIPKNVKEYAKDYMFLSCIKYINEVKTGPFAEHSNQLWGISGVSSWQKINAGLIRMYKAEVLGKFPVVQHIMFGSLLPLTPTDIVVMDSSSLKSDSQSNSAASNSS